MRTFVYVNFVGRNEHDEDTGRWTARFFLCAFQYPTIGLGEPLPPQYYVEDSCLSQHVGSVDLMIRLPEGSDNATAIREIQAHVQARFCPPSRACTHEDGRLVTHESKTRVTVGLMKFEEISTA